MNKLSQILCAAAILAMVAGCGKANKFTIGGTVDTDEANGKTVYLYNNETFNAGIHTPIDSAIVSDGKFLFKGTVDEPWIGIVANEYITAPVIVEPGQISLDSHGVGGTTLNDRMQAFSSSFSLDDIEAEMQDYIPLYYGATNATERAEAERILDSLEGIANARALDAFWKLYNENSDNILAVIAMEQIVAVGDFTYSELDSIVAAADPRVAKSSVVQEKLEQLRSIEATSVGKHYTDIQGVDGKLSDLIDGKVALVDFYASWCGPCRNEIKDNLVPLWKKYQKRGLVIVGLNVWERGDAAARKAAHEKVMADLGITYPQLVDSTATATKTYGVNGIPQIMLIGKDGTILARDLRGAAIEEAVIKALEK